LSWKVNSLSWALVLLAMRSPERSLTMAWLYWRVTIFMPLLCCHMCLQPSWWEISGQQEGACWCRAK
jgi:hypothetical protein